MVTVFHNTVRPRQGCLYDCDQTCNELNFVKFRRKQLIKVPKIVHMLHFKLTLLIFIISHGEANWQKFHIFCRVLIGLK